MKIAALIIGIDGWDKYTLPLVESIQRHEPTCQIVVIDNASATPYPQADYIHRTERLCYAKAINTAARIAGDSDWYVVLSNDVLCTGAFAHMLASVPNDMIAGPCLKNVQGFSYLEGWCVAAPSRVWNSLGGWDENFQVSSWEDVDFSTSAIEEGYRIAFSEKFPFIHLDQKQRFYLIPDYWQSENNNIQYFARKHVKGIA
jgi:GT2 family glycosyltransferase